MTETAVHVLGEPVSWAELLGFVTGIACVALAVVRRIENFPVGIVNIAVLRRLVPEPVDGDLLAERMGVRHVWRDRSARLPPISATAVRADPAAWWGSLTPAVRAYFVRRQLRDEDRAARVSGPVLVCDTNALATCIWQERYLGRSTADVEAPAASRAYALTVLTGDEIPFVEDGLRDGEHVRGWMTSRFRERLLSPWIEVHGSVEDRVEAVMDALRAG